MVLSRIRSRSNSARAPKRWYVSLPPGVEVSMLSVRGGRPGAGATSRLSLWGDLVDLPQEPPHRGADNVATVTELGSNRSMSVFSH